MPKKSKKKMTDADKRFLHEISTFEKSQKKLAKMVGYQAGENVESQQLAIQTIRSAITMLINVVPKAEKVFNKYRNERAAYAIVSLLNLLRELLKDLMSLSAVTQIGDKVLENAVEPALLNMAQTHISGLKEIRKMVYKGRSQKRILKAIDQIIAAESDHISEVRTQAAEQINSIVQL